jgi:twitching motility protein PilJ
VAQGLLAAANKQASEIRDAGGAVEMITNSIKEVDESATQSAAAAQRTLEVTVQGAQAVQNTINGMNSIREQIQDTAKRIKRLGESSQEIGEIVDLISDITEQTNVLALNAAIQAARFNVWRNALRMRQGRLVRWCKPFRVIRMMR